MPTDPTVALGWFVALVTILFVLHLLVYHTGDR